MIKKIITLTLLFFIITSFYVKANIDDEINKIIRDNEKLKEKGLSVFIKEIKGEKYLFIRLTIGQFITGRLRATIRRRKRAFIRVILRPRQKRKIRKLLRSKGLKPRKRFIIRIPSRTLRKVRIRAIYVARPLKFFVKRLTVNSSTDETIYTEEKPIIVKKRRN